MFVVFCSFCLFFLLGLSELEDLQERYSRLEHLYSEAVKERDEAIEERNKATVLIALQLQTETQELNEQINSLQNENKKLIEENEDLKIRLGYAKDDLNKLQQKHIKLQIEQEQCLQEKEDALALLKELETQKETLKRESNQEVNKQDEEKMANQQMVSEQYKYKIQYKKVFLTKPASWEYSFFPSDHCTRNGIWCFLRFFLLVSKTCFQLKRNILIHSLFS